MPLFRHLEPLVPLDVALKTTHFKSEMSHSYVYLQLNVPNHNFNAEFMLSTRFPVIGYIY